MRPLTDEQEKTWMVARIIAVALGLAGPALYLVIASFIRPNQALADTPRGGHYALLFYIILTMAILGPLVVPIVERVQVNTWRLGAKRPPERMYLSLVVLRLAFVEASFIYGFVVYLLTYDFLRLVLFYPIGLIWLAIYWPKRGKYEQFIQMGEVR